MNTISVLILTHNRLGRLKKCIDSVYTNQLVKPDKVYIYDDCSSDGTIEYLKSLQSNIFVVLFNDIQRGPGYGVKQLYTTCDTDYCVFVNDDDYWNKRDVIQHMKKDIVDNNYPDKIFYKDNDLYDWQLHQVFCWKTSRMKELKYFSLCKHYDDYTLQTRDNSWNCVTIHDYKFYVYTQDSTNRISCLNASQIYNDLHNVCKLIYNNDLDAANSVFEYINVDYTYTNIDRTIYNELLAVLHKDNDNKIFGVFDAVFVITMTSDKNRIVNVKNQFTKLGIYDKINIHWVSKLPINNIIAKSFRKTLIDDTGYKNFNEHTWGTIFSCSYNHLCVVTNAYNLGYERILICEDDIVFNDDINYVIQKFKESIPATNNADIIKYHTNYLKETNNGFQKIKFYCHNSCSTMCYSLNKKAMKKYIELCEDTLYAADMVFPEFSDDLSTYVFENNDICKNTWMRTNIC